MPKLRPIERIVVVGAGSWGTTVANLLAGKGFDVQLWAREAELAREITHHGENRRYLPGVTLHPNLKAATSLGDSVQRAELAVFAIPAQSLRQVIRVAALQTRRARVRQQRGCLVECPQVGLICLYQDFFRRIAPCPFQRQPGAKPGVKSPGQLRTRRGPLA